MLGVTSVICRRLGSRCKSTVSDVVAGRLADAGCKYAFGIPGGEVLVLINSLNACGVTYVQTRHENAGGFMAEGAHHITKAPGVLVGTIGPGVSNAVNVVAHAFQDRVPLLFLTGCIDPFERETFTHQVFDHQAVLSPVVKASFQLTVEAAAVQIDKAIAIAMTHPVGPVHIDVPISVASAETNASQVQHSSYIYGRPGPGLEAVNTALAASERPIMIAGMDVLAHHAEEATRECVVENNIPLITTYKAKGILREDHELALGAAGLSPKADNILLPLINEADLIVLVGYDPIEMRIGWRNPWNLDRARVIELTSFPRHHYVHQATESYLCDIALGLQELRGRHGKSSWSGGQIPNVQNALNQAFGSHETWGPASVVDEVRRCVPEDTIAAVDTGAHRITLNHVWKCFTSRTLLQSTGLCTMGCALPLAAGVKMADPRRSVVAFIGDASLEMVLGELAVLRDHGLSIPIIVFVDGSLALIEMKQRSAGLQNVGVDMGRTDFASVGRAMGGAGVDVFNREELRAAVRGAMSAKTFTLIAAHIPRKAYDERI